MAEGSFHVNLSFFFIQFVGDVNYVVLFTHLKASVLWARLKNIPSTCEVSIEFGFLGVFYLSI